MLVNELLQENQDKGLVGVPAGSLVIEMAEILLGEDLLQTITGRELLEKIQSVPPPYRDNLLNHSLDDTVMAYRTWSSLAQTQHFRSSVRVLDLTVICVMLLSFMTGGMFVFEYYQSGVLPTYERLSVTFLPMAIILVVQYCLNDSMLMALLAKLLIRRYQK